MATKVYTTIHIYQEDGNAWQIGGTSRKSFADPQKAMAFLRQYIVENVANDENNILQEFDDEAKKQAHDLANGFSMERADNEEDWSGYQDYFAVWATEVEE